MGRETQFIGLAFLSLPLLGWSLYGTWNVLSRPHVSLAALAVRLSLVFLTTKLSLGCFNKARFHSRARSLGCGPAAVFPSRDRILGIDNLLEAIRANNKNELLELLAARFEKVGGTYYFLALGRWLLLTSDYENVKTILGTKMDDWPIAGPRLNAVVPVLGAKSVFSSNGKDWHHARSMIRPAFVRDQVADLQCFDRHIRNLLARIPTDGGTVDLQEIIQHMTIDSSTDFMLGYSTNMLTNPSPEAHQFIKDFEFASHESARRARMGGAILFLVPHKRLDESVKGLNRFVRYYLQKAMADRDEKQGEAKERNYVFLDELLKSNASEQFVIDQILSIIIAGRDTTANAMTSVFWYLARAPEIVAKMRQEIADVGAENPSWEQLKGMKYLNNIIKEALRLCPPVATNSRAANKDTVLPRGGGPDGKQPILVPKGTAVRWSLYSLHRNKDVYGPDADEFRPERWDSLRVGWEYLPFHGGPRICLGQQFALTQISYTLYRVFQRFKAIETRDSGPIKLQTSLTVSFANGCLVGMTPA